MDSQRSGGEMIASAYMKLLCLVKLLTTGMLFLRAMHGVWSPVLVSWHVDLTNL